MGHLVRPLDGPLVASTHALHVTAPCYLRGMIKGPPTLGGGGGNISAPHQHAASTAAKDILALVSTNPRFAEPRAIVISTTSGLCLQR